MKKITTLLLICFYQFSFAQSTLTVQCQQSSNFPDVYYNQVLLDGNIIEYGICSMTPSFYVAIFDTSCIPWGTSYGLENTSNNFGNSNNNGVCRPRVEYFFIFEQNDINNLTSLDSLINLWIPVDHAFVIYTPMSYDASQVASLSPALAQTFENLWGVEAVQTQSMVVLFGVQGYPASFVMDTTIVNNAIIFNETICPHCEQVPPNAQFTTNSDTVDLAVNGQLSVVNQAIYFDSLVWNFGDGTYFEDTTEVQHVYTQVGTYEVQLIVYHGMCSDSMTQIIEVINTTGVEDLLLETGLRVYPNPNNGNFTVRFKNGINGKLHIVDILGRAKQILELSNHSLIYEINNLSKGIYLVEVVMDNGRKEIQRIEVI